MDANERIARLEREIEALKGKPASASPQLSNASPHQPFDPSSRLSVPASVTRDMVKAVPDGMVRDIVKDHLGKPTSLPTNPSRSPGKATPNYAEPTPLKVYGTENLGKKREA